MKDFSSDQLDRLIKQATKQKAKLEKGAEEMIKNVERLLKEHGVDIDELVTQFKAAMPAAPAKPTRKKRRKKAAAKKATRKKATRKKATAKKATRKKATAKKTTAKKATRKKTRGKKKVTRKVAPKYRNPANAEETWAGRGRKPKWVEAHLAAGGSMDDVKI
jgi:DNA-binding protein H-NS